MKNKELIDKLSKMNLDLNVLIKIEGYLCDIIWMRTENVDPEDYCNDNPRLDQEETIILVPFY